MAGALAVLIGVGGAVPFTASISAGAVVGGSLATYAFGTNTVVTAHGTGPYNYVWTRLNVVGTWTAASSTISQTVTASSIPPSNNVFCSYYCTVTDTFTGKVAVTNQADYEYDRV